MDVSGYAIEHVSTPARRGLRRPLEQQIDREMVLTDRDVGCPPYRLAERADDLVAGGIGNDYGVRETLLKEGEEEASIPRSLMSRAISAGAVSYRMETRLGIRDDVLFVYDLEMPADFVPNNRDGEIVHFELMPASAVLERIRTTSDFKFNVNLVILDFAVRHGLLRPNDPEYLDVATGLHRPLD